MSNLNDRSNTSSRLTAARNVRGSTVFNVALEELGRIEDVIIEEPAGRIAFAILEQGGILGIGAHHYPLRWELLRFNREMGGYIADYSYISDYDRDVGWPAAGKLDRFG